MKQATLRRWLFGVMAVAMALSACQPGLPTPASNLPSATPPMASSPGVEGASTAAPPTRTGRGQTSPTAIPTPTRVPSPTPWPSPTPRPTPTPLPTAMPVTGNLASLLFPKDLFPFAGYTVKDETGASNGSVRRSFSADTPATTRFWWWVLDLNTVNASSGAWASNGGCTWTGSGTATSARDLDARVVGDGAKACAFGFSNGSRLLTYIAGSRNVSVYLQVAPYGTSSDTDTAEAMASLVELQITVIEGTAPAGVTSTALRFKGLQAALLDGARHADIDPFIGPVTYKDAVGKQVTLEAYQGMVDIWVPSGMSLSPASVQTAVTAGGGQIAGQMPSIGYYIAQASPGKEGLLIEGLRTLGLDASPKVPIGPDTDRIDAAGLQQISIRSNQVQLDYFDKPICVDLCGQAGEKYLTLPAGAGLPYGTTTDPARGISHGALVQYYRLGRQPDSTETTTSVNLKGADVHMVLPLVLAGTADIPATITINLSLGPGNGNPDRTDWYRQLERHVELAGARDRVLLINSAGNDKSDSTASDAVVNSPFWANIIRVGSLNEKGEIIQNYSTREEDILYLPVVTAVTSATGFELCTSCRGTSFAAPQVQYLVNEVLRQRPGLTPAQIRQLMFDAELSPRRVLNGTCEAADPCNLGVVQVRGAVLPDPYDPKTLALAVRVAQRLYPAPQQQPQEQPQQGQQQPGNTFVPLGQRNYNLPLAFRGAGQLKDAEAGKAYEHWFCRPPPASPAFFCGVNATNDPVGGHPPYHFKLGPNTGFPPFGLTLNTNGKLSGTPHLATGKATPYAFSVCVTDLDGKSVCNQTSLTVKAAPATPTPVPTPTPTAKPGPVYNYYSGSLSLNVTIRGQSVGSSGVSASSTETLSVSANFSNVKVQVSGPQTYGSLQQTSTGTYQFTCSATNQGASASTTAQGTVQGSIISPQVSMLTGPTLPLYIILRYNMTETSANRSNYSPQIAYGPYGPCDKEYVPVPSTGQLAEAATIDLVSSPSSRTGRWSTTTQFSPPGGGYLYTNPMSAAGGTANFTGRFHEPGRGQYPSSYTIEYSGTLTLLLDRTGP